MISYKRVTDKIKVTFYPYRDFRTSRHIIVFESDDWGSIRMCQRSGWEELLKLGYAVDKRPYECYDTLESSVDLEALFDVLRKYEDYKGNHPVITANMSMANPNFEKIKQSDFQEYHFEPIADTYSKYFGDTKALTLMKQGIEAGVFMPQSHGREHFNVAQWLECLREGDDDVLTAFKYGMCGISPKNHPEKGNQMMSAMLARSVSEQKAINTIVLDGLRMFEELWGFKSRTFVAPRYQWNTDIERVLSENGVQLIQTSRVGQPAYKTGHRFFYSGKRNRFGQTYSVRNCKFEPAINERGNSVEHLLHQVDGAFSKHKLAIFSTHRINYVGGIDENNRHRTLETLDAFLTRLLSKYPDVEFMSSDKLIEVIK